jgi:hypothetical protein
MPGGGGAGAHGYVPAVAGTWLPEQEPTYESSGAKPLARSSLITGFGDLNQAVR